MMRGTAGRSAALTALSLTLAAWVLSGCDRGAPTDGGAGRSAGVKPPRAVVVVLIDTLRADRVGAYGRRSGLTPALDRLADEGVVYERVVSTAPWTLPSVASLFVGYYPGVHGVTNYEAALRGTYLGGGRIRFLDDEFTTFAEALRAAGFETAAFVANPFILRLHGFGQGFDHFDSSFAENTTDGDVVNGAVAKWLAERGSAEQPLLLYVHYMDAHGPYDARPEFVEPLVEEVDRRGPQQRLTPAELGNLGYLRRPYGHVSPATAPLHERLAAYREYWVARYEGGVRQADFFFGELRAQLEAAGLWDDALVIVTSDHGEALCEHGYWEHGFSVYDSDLHVPLLVRFPRNAGAGGRVEQRATLMDVMPSVVAWAGGAVPAGLQAQPLPRQAEDIPGRPVLAEAVKAGPQQQALYEGPWKLLMDVDRPGAAPRLYNVVDDPDEQLDVAGIDGRRVQRMLATWSGLLEQNERLAAQLDPKQVALSPEDVARLQSIGYAGSGDAAADSQPASGPTATGQGAGQ